MSEEATQAEPTAAVGKSAVERFVSADATHELECSHHLGHNVTDYFMKCIPLKTMQDGRKKVLVFGRLFWGGEDKKVRYVDAHRVHKIEH